VQTQFSTSGILQLNCIFRLPPAYKKESFTLKDEFSSPLKNDRWLFYALLSVLITFSFSNLYIHLFLFFSIEYNISPFIRILNSAVSLHLFMLLGIVFSYYWFSESKNWQKDFFFSNWKPLYILEAVGLEMGLFIPLGVLALITLKFLEFIKRLLGPDIAQYLDTTPHFKEFLLKLDWDGFALVAFVAVIIAPTIEEIVFRRVIYGFLCSKIGLVAAVIITSFLFAGIHFRLVAFPTLFILGIIWQLQFIYQKSLFPSILYHTFHNAVAMGFLFLIKFFNFTVN
jgi:membrane protease YdiL (CAAX protease family)